MDFEDYYELIITNKETNRSIELQIEDLKYLKDIIKQFDETKVDVELHRKRKERVKKIKL
jgi:hypothetical protein